MAIIHVECRRAAISTSVSSGRQPVNTHEVLCQARNGVIDRRQVYLINANLTKVTSVTGCGFANYYFEFV
jgi:hypothetical protein